MEQKDLEMLIGAYNEISALNVNGDAVDVVASAKAKMREVMTHLSEEIKKKTDDKVDQDDKPQSKPKGKKTE